MQNSKIESNLQLHLELLLPKTASKDVYFYTIFPCGKLFRAGLVWSMLKDLNKNLYLKSIENKNSAHAFLASSIECHHAYTLLHDDLPSMDNDTMRRGRPCAHLAFNEWKALLTGDGLSILSFHLLAKIKNIEATRLLELTRFFAWATGPKGLIEGQYLDLSDEKFKSLEPILHIHKLKTARLIQVSILGSALLAMTKDRKKEKILWRFSRDLGINFQLLDDLSELSEFPLSEHEKKINPWFLFPNETLELLSKNLDNFEVMLNELNLPETKETIKIYYQKMLSLFENKIHVECDISPIVLRLKRLGN